MHRSLAAVVLLTGCLSTPTLSDSPALTDGYADLPPGTSLAAGCAAGELAISWSVTEHPSIDHYEIAISSDGTELDRIVLGSSETASQGLDASVVDACATACDVALLGHSDADDPGEPLLSLTFSGDGDADGYAPDSCGGSDCDDEDDAIHPDATEVCDGIDNNCSGQTDDVAGAPDAAMQLGVCAGAKQVCDGQGGFAEPDYATITGYEAVESSCDGLDNDCDGTANNIATAPLATLQDGVCAGTTQVCDGTGWIDPVYSDVVWDYEAIELSCDGEDNDCNGTPDDVDAADAPAADLNVGECAGSKKVCASAWVEPDYTAIPTYELVEDSCDDLDNDCDGVIDTRYDLDPDTSTLECWGQYDRMLPERVDAGPWKQVASDRIYWGAGDNSCAIDMNDALYCWGDNAFGTSGVGDWTPSHTPRAVSGGGTWAHIEVSGAQAAGLRTDGSLWRWGAAHAISDDRLIPERIGTGLYAQVSLGRRHGCAIADDATLWCWGEADRGKLDASITEDQVDPVQIGTGTWSKVAAGTRFTCAIATDDALQCWGFNSQGESGADPIDTEVGPTVVAPPNGLTWTDVGAGWAHACALASDGSVWCWGDNSDGQLGNDDEDVDSFVPVRALGGPYNRLAVTNGSTCAATPADELWCWGSNTSGILGVGYSSANIPAPTLIRDNVGELGIGDDHSCFVSTLDDSTWCWGHVDHIAVGTGPEKVSWIADTAVSDVAGGDDAFCYIRSADQSLWCFGNNQSGQLGDGTGIQSYAPVPVMAGTRFVEVTSGYSYSCALDESQHRWCWGANTKGQLGFGGVDPEVTPRQDSDRTYAQIEAGWFRTCALDSDDALWCWGDGLTRSPVQQGTEVWSDLDVGSRYVCTTDAARDLACWGLNHRGQLGDGTTTDRSYADRVRTAGPWKSFTTGARHVCAIDDDDALWCWGDGGSGQLGNGSLDQALAPVQVPGSWTAVTAGTYHTCALDQAGSPWCWGSNSYYAIGGEVNWNNYLFPSPVQRDTPGWTTLSAGTLRTCGTRANYGAVECPAD